MEFKIEELQLIKKQLPTNYAGIIAIRVQVSETTIYKFFRTGKARSYVAQSIYDECLTLIEEEKEKTQLRKKRTAAILDSNSNKSEN